MTADVHLLPELVVRRRSVLVPSELSVAKLSTLAFFAHVGADVLKQPSVFLSLCFLYAYNESRVICGAHVMEVVLIDVMGPSNANIILRRQVPMRPCANLKSFSDQILSFLESLRLGRDRWSLSPGKLLRFQLLSI